MPTVEENLSWGTYSWPEQGSEWSQEWGDPETHWFATILPRIHRFLPAKRVLEIAPGFGRWTGYLLDQSESYIGVDLNSECVAACEKRFSTSDHARFVTNDGKSLECVEDSSVDFVFSFDSLVHAELDVMESYLADLAKKLSPSGIAFLHHSNLGAYSKVAIRLSKQLWVPMDRRPLSPILNRLQLTYWDHWRGPSVSAEKVAKAAKAVGLSCISQELVNWGRHNRRTVDCLSTITLAGSPWDRPNIVVRNPYFMSEARSAKCISQLRPLLESEGV